MRFIFGLFLLAFLISCASNSPSTIRFPEKFCETDLVLVKRNKFGNVAYSKILNKNEGKYQICFEASVNNLKFCDFPYEAGLSFDKNGLKSEKSSYLGALNDDQEYVEISCHATGPGIGH